MLVNEILKEVGMTRRAIKYYEYSGVAEPGIPPNRATLIPVAKARVSTTESHMKRGTFEHMCG